jgi:SseB protein N-terminal domain
VTLEKFEPTNSLEVAIVEAKQGNAPAAALLMDLAASPLFISSKTEVQSDGRGFEPLLLEESGKPLVATFSSLDRPALHSEAASYVLQMSGREFLLRLPPKYGVIINPGYRTQLIITPQAVSDFREKLKIRSR